MPLRPPIWSAGRNCERVRGIGDDGARRRPLVQALGRLQGARGGEPVAAVGVALQAREVVEQRRPRLALGALDRLDGRVGARDGGRDRLGALALGGAVVLALEPAAGVGARPLEAEPGVDLEVRLGLERVDLDVAAHDQRERRRLHPAERDDAAERAAAHGRCAGGVHADQPVGLGARPGGRLRGSASRRRRAGSRSPRRSRPSSSTTPTAGARASAPWRRPGCRRRSARPRGRRRSRSRSRPRRRASSAA